MTDKPLVSVIVPTYNRAHILHNALNSLLEQSYNNIEIIVVDDGSTDDTADLINRYNNDHIKYFFQQNTGQAGARNKGLRHASGDIVASLDSDDIWYPNFLEQCVKKLVADDLDFVFANWDQEDKDGKLWDFLSKDVYISPYFHKMENGWVNLNSDELRTIYVHGCPSPSSSIILKRSLVKKWNTEIKIGDDWYMYLGILYSGERKAAFTLDRLWKKRVDEINVYDGRKRSEVLEHLYISNMHKMLSDFKHKMSAREYKIMQKKHVYSLVELAKHNLIREFDLLQTTRLLGKSFYIDTVHTFKSIPEVINSGFKRTIDSRKDRKIPK